MSIDVEQMAGPYQPTPEDLAARNHQIVEGFSASEVEMGAERWMIGLKIGHVETPEGKVRVPQAGIVDPQNGREYSLEGMLKTHGYDSLLTSKVNETVLGIAVDHYNSRTPFRMTYRGLLKFAAYADGILQEHDHPEQLHFRWGTSRK